MKVTKLRLAKAHRRQTKEESEGRYTLTYSRPLALSPLRATSYESVTRSHRHARMMVCLVLVRLDQVLVAEWTQTAAGA